MVRRIGAGSYGEVWMAHSLTGARRAVKIVRRKNFDSAKAFEREFEGIQRYEPISRGHPSLLPILHVGEGSDRSFYYYIMEAADPASANASVYTPLTLETQGANGAPSRREIEDCWQIGRDLAEGLGQLHAVGLIHRDVKPSNVIFVNGKAKLADLGLVTSSGRRTFVGTEGYVPPDGPGAPQSDVYSLGMVLYELATGKDRMDFPELPDDFDPDDVTAWRSLNSVICIACATERGDRYSDGAAMAHAMANPDEKPKRRVAPLWWALGGIGAAIGAVTVLSMLGNDAPDPIVAPIAETDDPQLPVEENNPPPVETTLIEMVSTSSDEPSTTINVVSEETDPPPPPPPPKFGSVKIFSSPEHAEILSTDGELLGYTPKLLTKLKPGPVQYVLHLDGHRDEVIQGRIRAGKRETMGKQLIPWSPPEKGKVWVNSFGMQFRADEARHLAVQPVTDADYDHFRKAQGIETLPTFVKAGEGETEIIYVALTDEEKQAFCDWLAGVDREGKFFGAGHFYSWEDAAPAAADSGKSAFSLIADIRRFGVVELFSEPLGAEVFADGKSLGHTPLMLSDVPVGRVSYEIRMHGYNPIVLEGEVQENQSLDLNEKLTRSKLYLEDNAWTNSLGMRFVKLNGFACCVWETRVRDFEAFVAATEREPHHYTDLPQTEDHPVIFVSRTDALEFCEWLTNRERKTGWLGKDHAYNLPTDLQWSEAAGLPNEGRNTPEERDKIEPVIYPWGEAWPPPAAAGNFAASKKGNAEPDGFEFTSPVGTFEPRDNGIFDLAGNVWEWVLDSYGGENEEIRTWGVARGGCWSVHDETMLLTPYRNVLRPERRDSIYGFRIVIVKAN